MVTASERRVALILPPKERFTAGGAGAVALILRDLARASPPGWRSEVWGAEPGGPPFAGVAFRPVRPTLAQRLLSGRNGAFARAVARALAADPPAVVEAHNRAAVALAIAAALPRTPVMLVLHNEARQSEGLATATERAAVLQRLAGIVCVSDFLCRGVVEGLPAEAAARVHVLPNGLPLAEMPPPLPMPDRERRILFVGRLVPEKGPDSFIAACARALPALPGWRAAIVGARRFGESSDSPFVRALRQQAAAAGVEMLGFRDNAETLQLMVRAAIVVVPSRWHDPFPRVAQEALACGAALITSGRGGLPEATGEAALTADPDDPEALAQAILRLAGDAALRADLAARGRRHIAHFALPVIADRWRVLRERLLAGHGTAPSTGVARRVP